MIQNRDMLNLETVQGHQPSRAKILLEERLPCGNTLEIRAVTDGSTWSGEKAVILPLASVALSILTKSLSSKCVYPGSRAESPPVSLEVGPQTTSSSNKAKNGAT